MKILKTLKTSTIAIAAAAALAFCATSARAIIIPVTTNYSPVNVSITLATNGFMETSTGLKAIVGSQKFANKDLLNLLTNSDFAGFAFPTGSKLVIGWDWDGDLLVVDKNGSNILYNATIGTGGNSVAINFYNQEGVISYNLNSTGAGNFNGTWYNNASFTLIDTNSSVNLAANGPCTEHLTYKNFTNDTNTPAWTDSQSFKMYGANETNGTSAFTGTLTGTITASGSGKGYPFQLQQLGMSGRVP